MPGRRPRLIRLETTDDGFELSFKDRLLLVHTQKNPLLTIGVGHGRYQMSHGHFRVTDKIEERRRAGPFRVIERADAVVTLQFPGIGQLSCRVGDGRLHLSFGEIEEDWNRLWLSIAATRTEKIFGCGEQFSHLQLRGRKVPLFCQEQGVGRDHDPISLLSNIQSGSGGAWHSSYYPMAVALSTEGWTCVCDAPAYAEFDFRHPDRHVLGFWQVPREIILDVQTEPQAQLRSLTELLGRQPPLPDWVDSGLWLGVQGGSDIIRQKLQTATDAGIAVAALWVQDWVGRRITSFGSQLMWDWRVDGSFYPDMPNLLRELHGQGIRFLGYINPHLAIEGELYKEASAAGHCLKDSDGRDQLVTMTDFPAAVLDLTNPEARTWIKGVIKENMIGVGLDGWMADYGEYLPPGAVLHSGEDWEQIHNTYPVQWARTNMEAIQEAGAQDRVAFFVRAGNIGTGAAAPAVWAGDQLVNWSRHDGLPTVIPAALSLGLQGITQFHSDLGGFTTVAWIRRKKGLFQRWAELSAFSPLMRTHEGNRPSRNWQFDSDRETLAHLARMTGVFKSLQSYRRHAGTEYRESGLPLMRHLWIDSPQDTVVHDLQDQYQLGRDLMVAPVIKPRTTRRRVYLPDGDWVHLWSGKPRSAGWRIEAAPLGTPAVYYRADSSFAADFRRLAEQR